MFFLWARILQGCPTSAPILSPPILGTLHAVLHASKASSGRVCAGDNGLLVQYIPGLTLVHDVLGEVEETAGLFIKPAKCALVWLKSIATQTVIARLCEWLLANLPKWGAVSIPGKMKYLGVDSGPGAVADSWGAPVAAFATVARSIAKLGAAPAQSARLSTQGRSQRCRKLPSSLCCQRPFTRWKSAFW